MINPASAGPATEEISKIVLLQVTALVKAAGGTICGRIAERAGRLKVEKTPPAKMIQNMAFVAAAGPIWPLANDSDSSASASEQMVAVNCPSTAMVRRL